MGDVDAAMRYLRSLPYVNGKVGLIGFCSGGRQTYLGACTLSGVAAAVDCWGGGVTQGQDQLTPAMPRWPIEFTEGLNCPLLGLFGDEDPRPSVQDVAETEADKFVACNPETPSIIKLNIVPVINRKIAPYLSLIHISEPRD